MRLSYPYRFDCCNLHTGRQISSFLGHSDLDDEKFVCQLFFNCDLDDEKFVCQLFFEAANPVDLLLSLKVF